MWFSVELNHSVFIHPEAIELSVRFCYVDFPRWISSTESTVDVVKGAVWVKVVIRRVLKCKIVLWSADGNL